MEIWELVEALTLNTTLTVLDLGTMSWGTCTYVTHTNAKNSHVQFCTQCKQAFHCSLQCQSGDWKTLQKACMAAAAEVSCTLERRG